jgi:hypothetical protein
MTSRLDSLDNIKAVEWLNLYAIFLVPFARSRLPGHATLTERHVALLQRVATIVKLVSSYYTTEPMIDELHGELVAVMHDMEQLGPDTSSYVTPNMHLSLHLARQLRDHGPASSWWTFPYERLMGVTANIPFRPGRSSVDTAKRALALLEVSARAMQPQLDEKSRATGRFEFGMRLPDGAGFEHGVRRTDSGGRSHWYHFVGALGQQAARRLYMHRVSRCDFIVRGCEPYPGLLFQSGQLFKPHSGRTRSVQLADDEFLAAVRAKNESAQSLAHVRRCLLAHHLTTRWKEVRAAYDAAIAHEAAALQDEQTYFAAASTERTEVFASLLSSDAAAAWLPAPAAGFELVLQWYQRQCGAAWDRVDVYDKLFYAGEEFGSDIASGGQNAWISANFHGADEDSTTVWWGRASFYVRHTFAGRAHDFVAARWFDFAGRRPTEEDTREDYPVVDRMPMAPDIRDLIPVQRITGRWIAMHTSAKAIQRVCPIRSRLHG